MLIISTKLEVDITIHCLVIAFLQHIHYTTLTIDFLTLTEIIHGKSHSQTLHHV